MLGTRFFDGRNLWACAGSTVVLSSKRISFTPDDRTAAKGVAQQACADRGLPASIRTRQNGPDRRVFSIGTRNACASGRFLRVPRDRGSPGDPPLESSPSNLQILMYPRGGNPHVTSHPDLSCVILCNITSDSKKKIFRQKGRWYSVDTAQQ